MSANPDVAHEATSYDELPYESYAYEFTHPDRLAVVGRLAGMSPAPVERCRYLEIGCASGGNLIPMAARLPECEFVGIDLSASQIASGQALVEELGLPNLRLVQDDIMALDERYGKFDYVVAHGIYSWVPSQVQEGLLAACRRLLQPRGVAMVSYNVFPGWRFRGVVRDAMLFHAGSGDLAGRVKRARAMLAEMASEAPKRDALYGSYLAGHKQMLDATNDSYVGHEFLEDANSPVYFRDFARSAEAHGLKYLGDADPSMMLVSDQDLAYLNRLGVAGADPVQRAQYLDFVYNRTFLRTILAPEEAPGAPLDLRAIRDPARVSNLYLSSSVRQVDDKKKGKPAAGHTFRFETGTQMTSRDPVTTEAMRILMAKWPRSVSFQELIQDALARGQPGIVQDSAALANVMAQLVQMMLMGWGLKGMRLAAHPHRIAAEVSARPEADPISRFQAERFGWSTTQRHELVRLSPAERLIVPLLDGTRDRGAIAAAVSRLVARNEITLPQGTKSSGAGDVGRFVDQQLKSLLHRAMLSA